jgi:ClpX C4-type zinc finger/Sigma-70 region 3
MLVAGPGVYICDECIGLCNDIIEEEGVVIHEGDLIASPEDAPFSDEDARVFEARRRLTGRLGRRPTVAELGAELGLDEDNVTEILRRASPRPPETGLQGRSADVADLTPIPVALRIINRS